MLNIFTTIKDDKDDKDDIDKEVIEDNSELLTDNEDEDEDNIEQYNIATIKCIREKLIKRTETLKFLKTLFDGKIRKLSQSKCILELKYEK